MELRSFDHYRCLNCLVTAITVDWYQRLINPAPEDHKHLRLAKGLSYGLGVAISFLAVLIYWVGVESIIDKTNEFLGYFGGAVLGIFLLGVFTRRSKALPTVIGGISSVGFLVLLNHVQSAQAGYFVHPYMYCFVGLRGKLHWSSTSLREHSQIYSSIA